MSPLHTLEAPSSQLPYPLQQVPRTLVAMAVSAYTYTGNVFSSTFFSPLPTHTCHLVTCPFRLLHPSPETFDRYAANFWIVPLGSKGVLLQEMPSV